MGHNRYTSGSYRGRVGPGMDDPEAPSKPYEHQSLGIHEDAEGNVFVKNLSVSVGLQCCPNSCYINFLEPCVTLCFEMAYIGAVWVSR